MAEIYKPTGKMFTFLHLKKTYECQKINIGDEIILVKEPQNTHDKNAIAIMQNVKDTQNKIGYVANKDETILQNTLSANQLGQLLLEFDEKSAKGIITKIERSTNFMDSFVAELYIPEEKKANTKKNKEIKFQLEGSLTMYAGKKNLIEALTTKILTETPMSQPQKVLLKISGDKILGYFNEEMCGVVKDTNSDEYTMLKQYVEDNYTAIVNAVSVDRGKINCEIKMLETLMITQIKVEDATNRIINEGIATSLEIQERLEYLRRNKVPEVAIANLFSSYVLYSNDIKAKIPTKPQTLFVDNNGLIARTIGYINVNRNLLFEGDRGVGKNVLTETLAWLYNRPLYEFSSNSQHSNNALLGSQTFEIDKEDTEEEKKEITKSFFSLSKAIKNVLFGKKEIEDLELNNFQKFIFRILSKGDGKKLKFDRSSIIEAFEAGGIIVLDEFNTSLAHVMPIFNSLLDDRRRITVPSYGTINAHNNFCAIATQNKDYQGTFESNEATVDRFVPIMFPKLNSIESILQAKIPTLEYNTLMICQKLFEGIKKAIESGELSEKCLTIRGFIDACLVLTQGVTIKDALIDNIANKASDEEDKKAIYNMIDLIIK